MFTMHEHTWVLLTLIISLLYVFGLAGMHIVAEANIVDNYSWWFVVTLTTVGYGDYSPITSEGRFIAGTIMFFGIASIGVVIGKLSEIIIHTASKRIKGLGYMNHDNHTVLMGYRHGSSERVISELFANNPNEKIVLCSNTQLTSPTTHEEVTFIHGELASTDVLERCNASEAANVIIDGTDDNQTFITAFAFRAVNPTAYMVCYLNNEDHADKIKKLASASPSLNQVILPAKDYLMAQELNDKESSGVIQQLISNLNGANLYRYDIPENVNFTITFKDLFIGMKLHYGATVLAVKKESLDVNPPLEQDITPGMALFYTSSDRIAHINLNDLGAE